VVTRHYGNSDIAGRGRTTGELGDAWTIHRLWYDWYSIVASTLLFTNRFDFDDDEDVSSRDGSVSSCQVDDIDSTTEDKQSNLSSCYSGAISDFHMSKFSLCQ
jgi:hypothetical protein